MLHELKTDIRPFQDIVSGRKTFEVRKDDRGYTVGDILLLRDTLSTDEAMMAGAPLAYTGRQIRVEVTYILFGASTGRSPYGIAKGFVVMSIRVIV